MRHKNNEKSKINIANYQIPVLQRMTCEDLHVLNDSKKYHPVIQDKWILFLGK